jgi:ribosomal protein S27AE
MTRAVKVVVLCGASLLMAPFAEAQRSRCADCHYADPAAPRRDHLNEWDRSPHGRNNVGCEKCHGGNPRQFEKFLAHRGVLPSGDKASPANRQNLPATCGRCHTGPSLAFENSRHYQLLRTGSCKGPTCST